MFLPWLLGFLFAILNSSGGLYFTYPSLLLSREQVGAGSGLIDTLGYAGTFLITILIGIMVDAFKSYDPVFLVLASVSLIGALVILGVKPTH
jgi:sugar phosphate permease